MYNYILLNEGFYRWLETDHLPIQSQLLFLKLIHLFNLSGWSEWLVVDNQRMMALVQTKREQTVIEYRDKLLEKQLLFYIKGKKESPNKYKLNDELAFINEAKSVVKNEVNSVVKNVVYPEVNKAINTANIYKQNKTKLNKTKKEIIKDKFGEFESVLLTKEELDKLKSRLPEQTNNYIERLSNYIASTGKRYKSHYATILNWVQKDSQNNKVGGENYGNIGRVPDKKLCTEYPE